MDESRRQFEEWFCKKNKIPGSSVLACRTGDSYWDEAHCVTNGIQRQWECWQESRTAIEIELPRRKAAYASGYGDGYLVDSLMGDALEYDETVEAIRAAGIKVKE